MQNHNWPWGKVRRRGWVRHSMEHGRWNPTGDEDPKGSRAKPKTDGSPRTEFRVNNGLQGRRTSTFSQSRFLAAATNSDIRSESSLVVY